MSINKKIIKISILVILFFLITTSMWAINSIQEGFRGSVIKQEIDVHGTCKNVQASGTKEYFIPTNQSIEWTSFLAHPPADIIISPCYTYIWKVGGYGACSKSCGGGVQYRSVWCQRSDSTTVADSFCGGGKPATSRSCNTAACCSNRNVSLGTNGGTCSTACSNIGQNCSSTRHENWGQQGSHWGPWDPGCGYAVRGWSGDCGSMPGKTSCGSNMDRVTVGSATCYCSCR